MTPASPAETSEQRTRAVNMIASGHTYEAVAELMARACPKPSLHAVEGAPLQRLADLLRAATEFDEIAQHLVDEYDLLAIELERIDALRTAVRALNEPATGGAA